MTDVKNPDAELLERLTKDIDEAGWDILEDHHKRGALFLVSQNLELAPVGFSMANDQVDYIRNWLTAGELSRPTEEAIKQWIEEEIKFNYLIIQPYVLIQHKKEDLQ